MANEASVGRAESVLGRPGVRQFVKFCIVGASSTIISTAIFSALVYGLHLDHLLHQWLAGSPGVQQFFDRYRLYVQVAALAGFVFAVTNGFIWNSRWTFRQNDADSRRRQYVKFILVNVIGLVLNQIILFLVNRALTSGHISEEKGWEPLVAFVTATGIVVFWNFFANKLWTFKD